MKYVPYGDRIIIKKLEDKQEGSIVIPKSAGQEEKAIGIVVHSGSSELFVNQLVIYDEFAGSVIPGEKDLIILNIKDILALKYV